MRCMRLILRVRACLTSWRSARRRTGAQAKRWCRLPPRQHALATGHSDDRRARPSNLLHCSLQTHGGAQHSRLSKIRLAPWVTRAALCSSGALCLTRACARASPHATPSRRRTSPRAPLPQRPPLRHQRRRPAAPEALYSVCNPLCRRLPAVLVADNAELRVAGASGSRAPSATTRASSTPLMQAGDSLILCAGVSSSRPFAGTIFSRESDRSSRRNDKGDRSAARCAAD